MVEDDSSTSAQRVGSSIATFILATLGTELQILPAEGRDLILAGANLSIFLNPFLFTLLVPKRQDKPEAPGGESVPRSIR